MWASAAPSWRRCGLAPGRMAERAGGPPRLLVAKPGLDGHSNGAEQIAVAARDAGFEVDLPGHPPQPRPDRGHGARRGRGRGRASRSCRGATSSSSPSSLDRLRAAGVDAPVVVGGIIPPDDAEVLRGKGVAAVFTPKDFEMGRIMDELVTLAEHHRRAGAVPAAAP